MTGSSSQQQLSQHADLTTPASLAVWSSQQVSTLASILASLGGPSSASYTGAGGNASAAMAAADQQQQASSLTFANNLLSEQQLNTISEEDELKLLNFPSKREDLSTAIPLTVIFALLLVTGCIGNICTAIVIARPKNKYMHTATNYYLFSLAMSDFLFLILGLPQEMYTLWQRYPYAFGESFCIIRGYLSEASTYASILTISAFTVERYVAICHPLWAHTMSQLPRAITSIVIIWCLAAICAIPPAAELGIVTQKGPLTNRTLEQSAQCATKRTIYENMFVVSAIVFFIVPMVIVTVLYILIAIELRRSSRMNNAISKQTSSHLYSQQSTTTTTSNQNNNNSLIGSHNPCCHHNGNGNGNGNHLQHQHRHHNHHHHHHHHHQRNHHHKHKRQLAKPRSHQHLAALVEQQQQQKPPAAGHEQQASLQVELAAERPQSAIGTERAPTSPPPPPMTANCCLLASGLAKAGQATPSGGRPLKSPTLGSLARLQLPSASKLCSQLLGAGFWSGYNLTSTGAGPDEPDEYQTTAPAAAAAKQRPESALSCRTLAVSGPDKADDRPPAAATQAITHDGDDLPVAGEQARQQQHLPLSRQHSPLSYHESLMQRGCHHHHSAMDMSGRQGAAGQQANSHNCHHSVHGPHKHAPPHHQLSLTQLPTNQQQRQMLLLNHHQHQNSSFKAFQAASQQQQQQQHSRRSNAASSKKSVIRMLGK
jgi:neuromedin U receptor 1